MRNGKEESSLSHSEATNQFTISLKFTNYSYIFPSVYMMPNSSIVLPPILTGTGMLKTVTPLHACICKEFAILFYIVTFSKCRLADIREPIVTTHLLYNMNT